MSNDFQKAEVATVSAQVSAATRRELEQRAAAGDRSLSSEIRRAIREHLERIDDEEEDHRS